MFVLIALLLGIVAGLRAMTAPAAAYRSLIAGLTLGAIGAVVGTYGGAAVRGSLAKAFGKDLPAALVEDVAAILLSILAVAGF
jgi:uncharacterized membrane protein